MEKQIIKTDLLIIGAGPGGYVAAIYAAKKGLAVVLVDRKHLGGTCLNVGCIPTKSLVKSVEIFTEAKEADKFGVTVENASIDLAKVVARKDSVTCSLVDGISTLLKSNNVNYLEGACEFTGTKEAIVKNHDQDTIVLFQHALIATGGKTKHLPISGIDLDIVYDSEKLLANTSLPQSLVIIGGGIIGMEFAFIYGKMGVKVDVIEFLPQILPTIDKDLSQRLFRYAKQANITITTGARVTKVAKDENGKAIVSYIHKEEEKEIASDIVLEAVGRIPETSGLHLEVPKVALDRSQAIIVDKRMQTNIEGIYAIGDVTNIMQLAHVASHQALIAVENILGNHKEMDYSAVPSVIFTMPQIATIGKSETELQQANRQYNITKVPFSANGKALITDNALGFIKIMADPETELILGAAVFGGDAEHLIAPLTVAMQNSLSASELKETIFAHPTTSELIHEGALGLLKEAIHYLG